MNDISERKKSEQEHARLEQQLRQAQKMEAVGRLAGGVAHDFNNLLTVIKGYSEVALCEIPNDAPVHSLLQEIHTAGERAAELTRQLLAFGRKQVMAPRFLSLNEVVSCFAGMLRRIVREDIELLTRLAPDLGTALADPGQIEQVVMNLVVNARDAMPEGGRITITTANVDMVPSAGNDLQVRSGPCVMLAVSDTGCGMDEETKRLIFEPFFTTKETGKGTGLGLATVYGIVRQSGGWVSVDSEPGKGSSFKVFLPRVNEQPMPVGQAPAQADQSAGHETILLVEDQDAVRKLFGTALKARGYTVLTASNGPEALALPDDELRAVDLLLSDVVMPDMSGIELAKRVKVMLPNVRVLLMSGYTPDELAPDSVLGRGVTCLMKPFSPAQLTTKVREVLSGPRN
jgi:nitrogen-specific signal transduction histidine kinase